MPDLNELEQENNLLKRQVTHFEDDFMFAYNFVLEMEREIKQFKRLAKPIKDRYIDGRGENEKG